MIFRGVWRKRHVRRDLKEKVENDRMLDVW